MSANGGRPATPPDPAGQRARTPVSSNQKTDSVRHTDLALAERCRNGEAGAFEELYRAHAPRLFGLACRFVGRAEAEDLLQDIFLTAHRKLGLYRGQAALGTWLFRLATNQCLDYLRSRKARFALVTDPIEEEPGAGPPGAGSVLGVVDRLDLERALAALPPGCRQVFVLHDVEGREHREIAELLAVSDGTSKSQLHKARMRLRTMLSGGAARHGRPV
jgi:RNA polymerase sigma-70 factor (ECF subfamily)